ncbi:hypothetical protein E2562_029707 [Oryza meyeriana var. granulata]|uniref:Uncharacterized protein n=1 Tax=Oryza meyeriana var. granulata TaxID=110450 RepID=A0A6G1C0Y7_9ORYZ|nr:hypothetical protein E2562_029707 [Oryza meyeriana var. granulata]
MQYEWSSSGTGGGHRSIPPRPRTRACHSSSSNSAQATTPACVPRDVHGKVTVKTGALGQGQQADGLAEPAGSLLTSGAYQEPANCW